MNSVMHECYIQTYTHIDGLTQLHHERSVCRGRHPTRFEVLHRQASLLSHILDQLVGGAQILSIVYREVTVNI